MLVATAVLVVLLGVLFQILDGTMRSSRVMNQQIDAIRDARMALDVLCADLDNAVTSEGGRILLSGSGAGTQLAFVTRSRGPSDTSSRFLAVSYRLSTPATTTTSGFIRSYTGVAWNNPDLPLSATLAPSGSPYVLSKGVLAWSVAALMTSGSSIPLTANASLEGIATEPLAAPPGWRALQTISPTLPQGVRSLQVTLAAMDEKSLQRFSPELENIQKQFNQPSTNQSAADIWNTAINQNLKASVRSSIRVLSKTVDLP